MLDRALAIERNERTRYGAIHVLTTLYRYRSQISTLARVRADIRRIKRLIRTCENAVDYPEEMRLTATRRGWSASALRDQHMMAWVIMIEGTR